MHREVIDRPMGGDLKPGLTPASCVCANLAIFVVVFLAACTPCLSAEPDERPNLVYPIPHPDGSEVMPVRQWWWSKSRTMNALENKELVFTEANGIRSVSYKQYLFDDSGEERLSKPFSIIDQVFTQNGTLKKYRNGGFHSNCEQTS